MRFFVIVLSILLFSPTVFSGEPNKITLTEKDAVRIGLENNWDILIKDKKIKEAEALLEKSYSKVFPQLSTFFYFTNYNDHPFISYQDNRGYGFEAKQVIFDLSYFYNIKSAYSYLDMSKAQREEEKNYIISQIKKAFLHSILAKESLNTTKESLELARKYYETVTARYRTGESSDYDVLRAEVEVKNLEYKFLKAQAFWEVSLNYLKILLGIPSNVELVLVGELEHSDFDCNVEELLSIARNNRPLIRSLIFNEDYLKDSVNEIKGEFLPNFTVTFQDNFNQKETFSSSRSKYDDYWTLTARLNFPIFEGGLRLAKIKEKEAQLGEVELLKEKLIAQTEVDIRDSVLNIESAKRQIEATQKNVENAQKMYDIVYKRYLRGELSYLDILDSRNVLLNSKLNYLQALFDYNSYIFELDYLTGKNLDIEEVKE